MLIGKTDAIGSRVNHRLTAVQTKLFAGRRRHCPGAGTINRPDVVRVQAYEGVCTDSANHRIDVDDPRVELDLERRGVAGVVERVIAVVSAVDHAVHRGLIGVDEAIAQQPALEILDVGKREHPIDRATIVAGNHPLVVDIRAHENVVVGAAVK